MTGGDAGAVHRFAVDRMLGRLARWLRILGHDVAYGPHLGGRGLVACARGEGRLLLTRDTRLVRQRHLPPHLFIRSDRFRDQLREVVDAIDLRGGEVLGRCLECNRPLHDVPRAAVADRVPAYVAATAARFHACAGCGRVYWPATHRAHVLRELEALGLSRDRA
jgi:uncharacterized protein